MERKIKGLETDLTGQDSSLLDREQNMETQIKNEKKAKAREQLKILKQFESMAEQFQNQDVKNTKVFNINQQEKAGDIKKREREKNKKEKTLGAKLRLKAKKQK